MERIPKSHFCNEILLCHTDWLTQLLTQRAIPETFSCHTHFDENEVEAFLRQVLLQQFAISYKVFYITPIFLKKEKRHTFDG